MPRQHPIETLLRSSLLITLGGILAACTPMTDTEKEYLENRKREREAKEAFEEDLERNATINAMISKVKGWKQEDGRTAQQFVQVKLDTLEGQKMMGQWNVDQEGEQLFHVTYRFLYIGADYTRERRGYRWIVNEGFDRIVGPEELDVERVQSRKEKESMTRNLRSRDPWSLE